MYFFIQFIINKQCFTLNLMSKDNQLLQKYQLKIFQTNMKV